MHHWPSACLECTNSVIMPGMGLWLQFGARLEVHKFPYAQFRNRTAAEWQILHSVLSNVSFFEYTLNISQFAYCIMCSYTETGRSSIITQYCDTVLNCCTTFQSSWISTFSSVPYVTGFL